MGNHRLYIRTTGNTDEEVEFTTKVATRLLQGYGAKVEKVTHDHNNEHLDLTKIVTGHDPVDTYDDYWSTMPIDAPAPLIAYSGEGEQVPVVIRTHYASTDLSFMSDYVSIEVLVAGLVVAEWGDAYHDKGKEHAEGFVSGLAHAWHKIGTLVYTTESVADIVI